jgi:hypothetical protein
MFCYLLLIVFSHLDMLMLICVGVITYKFGIVFRFVDVFSCIKFDDFCSMYGLQFYDFVLHLEIFYMFTLFCDYGQSRFFVLL